MSEYTDRMAKSIIAQIDNQDYHGVQQTLATEYETLSTEDFKAIIKAMETASKKTATPDVYMELNANGEPTVYINDSSFKDTKLFSPTISTTKTGENFYDRFRPVSKALSNAEHESLAQDVAKAIKGCGGDSTGTYNGDLFWAKQADGGQLKRTRIASRNNLTMTSIVASLKI